MSIVSKTKSLINLYAVEVRKTKEKAALKRGRSKAINFYSSLDFDFVLVLFWCLETGFFHVSPDWPGTCHVVQGGLELLATFLSQLPRYWHCKVLLSHSGLFFPYLMFLLSPPCMNRFHLSTMAWPPPLRDEKSGAQRAQVAMLLVSDSCLWVCQTCHLHWLRGLTVDLRTNSYQPLWCDLLSRKISN